MFNINKHKEPRITKFKDQDGSALVFAQAGYAEDFCPTPVDSFHIGVDRTTQKVALIIETCPLGGPSKEAGSILAQSFADKMENLFSSDEKTVRKQALELVANKIADRFAGEMLSKDMATVTEEKFGMTAAMLSYTFNKEAALKVLKTEDEILTAGGYQAKSDFEVLTRKNEGVKVLVDRSNQLPIVCVTGENLLLAVEKIEASGLIQGHKVLPGIAQMAHDAKRKYLFMPDSFKPIKEVLGKIESELFKHQQSARLKSPRF